MHRVDIKRKNAKLTISTNEEKYSNWDATHHALLPFLSFFVSLEWSPIKGESATFLCSGFDGAGFHFI